MASTSWQGALEDVRRARTAKGRLTLGAFVVEGPRMLGRALAAGADILRVVADETLVSEFTGELLHLVRGPLTLTAPSAALRELTDGRESGRLVALVRLPEAFANGNAAGTGGVAENAVSLADLMLVAVDVEEPGNVGALLRSAHASGAAFLAVGATDPFHPKAVRTSLGSVFRVAAARFPDASRVLGWLDERGMLAFAAVSHGGAPVWDASLDATLGVNRTAIVVGSEAQGLSASLVQRCAPVTIPMPDGVDSFSVNAAAAILLYEARRRRARR